MSFCAQQRKGCKKTSAELLGGPLKETPVISPPDISTLALEGIRSLALRIGRPATAVLKGDILESALNLVARQKYPPPNRETDVTLVARVIRNAIRANRFVRSIRN